MARRRPKSSKPDRPQRPADIHERIFAAAMAVAARTGWRRAALRDVAQEAGLSLAELHAQYRSKAAILNGIGDHADRAVLAETPQQAEDGQSPRDRLFDVLMRRFETLAPYREGLAAIAREAAAISAIDAVCGVQRMLVSMSWMLEAAQIGSGGMLGTLRAKGLAIVYAATFATWLRDDSSGLDRTMAALDRNLARAERFSNTFSARGFRRERPGRAAESGAAG